MLCGKRERGAVAGREQSSSPLLAAAPYRADRMDDVRALSW